MSVDDDKRRRRENTVSPSSSAGTMGAEASTSANPSSSERRGSVLSALDLRFVADDDDNPAQEAIDEEAEEAFRLSDPRVLRQLMERIVRPGAGVPLGTKLYQGAALHNCFTGAELADWIRKQDCFITDARSAKVLGQALLESGYIRTFVPGGEGGGDVFDIDDVPYRASPMEEWPSATARRAGSKVRQESKSPDGEDGGNVSPDATEDESDATFPEWVHSVMSSSRQNALDRKREKSRTRDKSRGRKKSKEGKVEPQHQQQANPIRDMRRLASQGAATADQKLSEVDLKARKRLVDEIYRPHVRAVLVRILSQERLDEDKWLEFVGGLAERITSSVDSYTTADEVDVRKFVKVKKFPGGRPEDSKYVNGEIFTNRVVRTTASLRQERPRIILVGGSVRPREHGDKVSQAFKLDKQLK